MVASVGSSTILGSTSTSEGRLRRITLIAMEGKDGSWTYNGTIPAPLLIIEEGDTVLLTLINHLPGTNVSVHVHGVHYDIFSDGTIHTRSYAPPGGFYVYKWFAAPGTAGTWPFHDHVALNSEVEGTERGLYGAVVVRKPGELPPDREFLLVMIGTTFNGKKFPNAPLLVANLGERVRFHIITLGSEFHTFHLHGHRWIDPGTTKLVDTKTIGPAESYSFEIIAGEGVGVGDWMYHCHVHQHIRDGMIGFFRVTLPGQEVPSLIHGNHTFPLPHP